MSKFEIGVDIIEVIKNTNSLGELIRIKKAIYKEEMNWLSNRKTHEAIILIKDRITDIDVKDMMVELFEKLI